MKNFSASVINYRDIKARIIKILTKNKRFTIPFLLILFYVLLYFLVDFSSQSLVAHDEGLYARRARLIGSLDNWFSSPFPIPHHKTLGSYWFIALSIRLFGNSEFALRLPSIISSFLCLYTLYFIVLEIANRKSALICLFSLSSMPLWIQYSRYASPDIPFVLSILLVILFFLKSLNEFNYTKQFFYILFSGLFLSTSFFIRSYMTFVPLVGLTPFLSYHLFRKDNTFKITFLTGILIGSIPTLLNLYFAFQKFGSQGITSLFDFAKRQAVGEFGFDNLILLPLNFLYLTFPIGLLFLILFVFTRIKDTIKYPLLVFYYPFISLSILLCMSRSYPHYYLFLLPSLSILFAVNVTSNSFRFSFSEKSIKSLLVILFLVIIFLLLFFTTIYKDFIIEYSARNTFIIYIISSFLLFSYIISIRFLYDVRHHRYNLIKFFYCIVIPQYISLSLLFNFGILGSPNLDTKLFLRDEQVSSIINSNTIYLFEVESKIETLLSYYLPSSKVVRNVNDVLNHKYLITSDIKGLEELDIKSLFRLIKKFDNQFLLINISK